MIIQKKITTKETKHYSFLNVKDNVIFVRANDDDFGNEYFWHITLDIKDILNLDKWKLGQEKHTQEELTSLRKKVDTQESSNPECGPEIQFPEENLRTDKDIENQHKLNQIRDELADCGFGNITVVNAYEKIQEIVSNKENIPQGAFAFDIDKIKENQKIADELLKEWKSAEDEEGGHYEQMLGNILTRATGKDIKNL